MNQVRTARGARSPRRGPPRERPEAGISSPEDRAIRLGLPLLLSLLALTVRLDAASPTPINPPLGPYLHPQPADFTATTNFSAADRITLTPYFYWYDVYSSAHVVDGDGSDALTDHPPTLTDFSYKSKQWHKTQLLDMIAAGIDVLLPVYWGEPSQRIPNRPLSAQPWSFSGIPPLVQAREELLQEGRPPPAIGLFYDTSTLEYNGAGQKIDLTTDYGRRWFYETVRDFFSLLPAKHWAMIDGKPVVVFYAAAFAAKHDQTCIDYLRATFAQDFSGRVPFIVREVSWQVQTENVYAWGGALGLRNPGVASLGPGYDDSAVPGRRPTVVNREAGAFFARQWTKFLRAPSSLVMLETWNEYHEATDIAASREYGRQYLELNRKFVDWFKLGVRPPLPTGPYTDRRSITVSLQQTNVADGLEQLEEADGATAPTEVGGSACRQAIPTIHGGRFIYFRIADSFKWADPMQVDVEVEYFDSATGTFRIEFDGSDTNAPFQGAYTASLLNVRLRGSNAWTTARFGLTGAHLRNAQNGGADFRIAVNADPFYVRRVTVIRRGIPVGIGQPVHGFQQDFGQPLGTNWTRDGQLAGVFEQADGLLIVRPATGLPQRLLVTAPGAAATVQEVLARVRVVSFQGSNDVLGGITVAFNSATARGLNCGLQTPGPAPTGIILNGELLPGSARGSFPWLANTWYWLRLRHQTNALTNTPDLFARIWLADGQTAEPDSWLTWWDYFPAAPPRQGLAGILAGAVKAPSRLEFDYFLLLGDGLPTITPRLPPHKPRRATLRAGAYSPAGGFALRLSGEPDTGYFIQASGDFAHWNETAVATDLAGNTDHTDPTAARLPRRFYRALPAPSP